MSKKDYILLAQALKDSKPMSKIIQSDSEWQYRIVTWKNTVETLAMTLQQNNLHFNRDRFLAACGYNS